jgi:hypothetical protein
MLYKIFTARLPRDGIWIESGTSLDIEVECHNDSLHGLGIGFHCRWLMFDFEVHVQQDMPWVNIYPSCMFVRSIIFIFVVPEVKNTTPYLSLFLSFSLSLSQ